MSCCTQQDANDDENEQGQESRSGRDQNSISWHIRPMRHADIEKCLEIWRRVELTEAHVMVANALTTDPSGFYVAELEPSGDVIGMCAGTITRHDTAFMGFYGVEPEHQGVGVGRELWATTIARLNNSALNIGLYGVPSMLEKYKKSGFKLEDSIRMLIYESQPGKQLQISELKHLHELRGAHLADANCEQQQSDNDEDSASLPSWRIEIIDGRTSALMIKKLIDFDERLNRFSREKLLRNYLTDGAQVPLTVAIVKSYQRAAQSSRCPPHPATTERKLSCCLKPSQEAIKEDEALCTSVKGSLSISAINSVGGELHLRSSSPIDIPSVSSGVGHFQPTSSITNHHHNHHHHNHNHHHLYQQHVNQVEIMGYGCIRHDNTGGAMIGPIYARTNDIYELVLRELVDRFDIGPGGKYSAMSLTSNEYASKVLERIGFQELDQCSRMFTQFVPEASMEQIYLVHSPNFTLF